METMYFGKTFDEIFDKHFHRMTRRIEDHQFRHYNHSIGMYIYSKEHLRYEMKKRRMLPYDACEQLADNWQKEHPQKPYDEISPKAMNIIRSLKQSADKYGNLRLGGRAIDKLKEIGAIQGNAVNYGPTGGFSE